MFCIYLLKLPLFRFQEQIKLYKNKASDFHKAMEEAMLAEDGILDLHLEAEQNLVAADSYKDQVILYLSLCIAYDHA